MAMNLEKGGSNAIGWALPHALQLGTATPGWMQKCCGKCEELGGNCGKDSPVHLGRKRFTKIY